VKLLVAGFSEMADFEREGPIRHWGVILAGDSMCFMNGLIAAVVREYP
jgi:hypothetical protein